MKKSYNKSKVVHLVAGFGIFSYFKNCLDSFKKNINDNSKVIICVTGNPKFNGPFQLNSGSLNQEKMIKQYVKKNFKEKNYIYKKIKDDYINLKTGNLYKAYNYALNYCIKHKINYLNIVQNDMQLMFWDRNMENILIDIFEKNQNCFFIHSGFIRQGSHPLFFNNNKRCVKYKSPILKNRKKLFYINASFGDFGFFNIKIMKKIKFKFINKESYLNDYYKSRNFKGILSPIPFIGVIPWPVYVRHQAVIGIPIVNNDDSLLKWKKNSLVKIFKSNKNFFQEEVICSNKWSALQPQIYTNFKILNYIKLLYIFKFKIKKKILFYEQNSKKSNFINFFISLNARKNIYELILTYIYEFLVKLIVKIRTILYTLFK